jgi:hypothetical protein
MRGGKSIIKRPIERIFIMERDYILRGSPFK